MTWSDESAGQAMFAWMKELFPIGRSLTGDGVRRSLRILQREVPLTTHEVPSGTQVFDWTVPEEWNVREAFIADSAGRRLVDVAAHNLHLVGYSVPVDCTMTLAELQPHLHSLPGQPQAIPYVTSYYERRWGFCLTHRQREQLAEDTYRVRIDSDLRPGHLTYGELLIPGERPEEIFLSTYVCHPSMANNELSGPVLLTALAKWILGRPRRHSYRLVWIPETIGSLTYVSRNLDALKRHVIAGFNLTCVGDERAWSFMPSRRGDTLADRVARHVLSAQHPDHVAYSFLQRGSDERQYCSPGIDLPVVSVMRSKYGTYPEYHTSLDDMTLVTARGLQQSYDAHVRCLELLEANRVYRVQCLGEPQLGRRGLYPTLSGKGHGQEVRDMMNVLAYADGSNDLLDIGRLIDVPVERLLPMVELLLGHRLLAEVERPDA